jgi:hypothetical protein
LRSRLSYSRARIMPPFMYRCPNTGNLVQGFVAEEMSGDASSIEAVTCLMCLQVHYVNPATGKVLGEESQ